MSDTCRCGHPTGAHDAGECWWDTGANIESDNPVQQCPCSWYEPAEVSA